MNDVYLMAYFSSYLSHLGYIDDHDAIAGMMEIETRTRVL